MMKTQLAYAATTPKSTLSRAVSLLGASLLGVLVVGGVGFAGSPAIHDAAHDVRHTLSFPCH